MPEISWETEEFEQYRKSIWWYLLIVVLIGLLLLLAWFLKNWIMALVMVVAAGAVIIVGRVKPRLIKVAIDEEELKVGDKRFPLSRIKSFWIVKTPEGMKVNFLLGIRFAPLLTLKIPAEKTPSLREFLRDKLPEESERGEDLIDRFNRFLRI